MSIRKIFSLFICVCCMQTSVMAAQADKGKKQQATFKRFPVLHTKYTRSCPKRLGLTKAPKEKKAGYTLNEKTYKKLLKAQDALVKDDYKTALTLLKSLEASTKSRKYDFAIVNQNMNHVYTLQKNYKQAIKHLKVAVDLDVFAGAQKRGAINNLAQLYIQERQFKKALKLLNDWFKTAVNPKVADYTNLAYAYSQTGDLASAVCPARIAINISPTKPKQALFDLLLGLHWEKKDYSGAVNILKENIQYYPETKKLWVILASAYGQLKRPKDALATWELAYKQDFLEKESEIKNLYSYYGMLDIPYKAATVLQAEIKKGRVKSSEQNWRSVANSWYMARELDKSVVAFGEAANVADSGDLYVRQGEVYVEMREWAKAVSAFERGMKKGKIDKAKEGRAVYRMGIALFNQGKVAKAKKVLNQAKQFNAQKKNAKSWLNYISDWERQQKLLKEA